jgi:hypothetical protein
MTNNAVIYLRQGRGTLTYTMLQAAISTQDVITLFTGKYFFCLISFPFSDSDIVLPCNQQLTIKITQPLVNTFICVYCCQIATCTSAELNFPHRHGCYRHRISKAVVKH